MQMLDTDPVGLPDDLELDPFVQIRPVFIGMTSRLYNATTNEGRDKQGNICFARRGHDGFGLTRSTRSLLSRYL